MFDTITPAPPDAILGLTEAFKNDPNPRKINLGVGVYKDADGTTPVLGTVKEAEKRLLRGEQTKSYLPIEGSPEYGAASQRLIFGDSHEIVTSGRAVTAQVPGGTGALRVAGDFIRKITPGATVWVSDPTWPNHPSVFQSAGLKVATYPYFDAATNGVDFEGMLATIRTIPAGDVLLLHGCCHNPTGVDLSPEQWQTVAEIATERGILPLLDFAYQGFAAGLEEDAMGVRAIAAHCPEMFVASSFSKNFGLYNERVGALTVVARTPDAAAAALSHVKRCIRANYSNPPAHGGEIVRTILGDPELRQQWEGEVTAMRERINTMRHLFVETLNEKGVTQDFSFITHQRGMFSFSGLTPAHVKALRERHSVYIVGSGRLSVAGMTEGNMDYLCAAIADVLKG
ncbi:MAG: amino acid aminotransferase [Caldilineaceae bacterium]